jgi:hypothetical protein
MEKKFILLTESAEGCAKNQAKSPSSGNFPQFGEGMP